MYNKRRILSVVLSIIMISTLFYQVTVINAAIGSTFKASIINIPTGKGEQNIECTFKIITEATREEPGEVQVGNNDTAIPKNTEGIIKIPDTVIDSLTSYEYNVTTVGDFAFWGCDKILNTGLEDNKSITKVGKGAYKECKSITSTGLSNNHSVESIGVSSFERCTNLLDTGLSGNDTLTSIGYSSFLNCESLKKTGLENNSFIKTLNMKTFENCTSLETTGLESNSAVTTVASNVFANCTALKTTGLKDNKTLTEMSASMFLNCKSLTSTGLEENELISAIPNQAFQGCTGLTSLVLGKNSKIESLGRNAFNGCINLTKVVFGGKNIPTLNSNFNGTNSVIYYPSWANEEDVAKLNAYESKNKFDVSDVVVDTSQLNNVYKVGDNMSLDKLNFIVKYKALNEADTLFEEEVEYNENNKLFSYTPILLIEGKNTIKGTYREVGFSFDVNAHGHTYSNDWKSNSTNHWHECTCGDKVNDTTHVSSDWIVDKTATLTETGSQYKECTICKYKIETATIPKLLDDVIISPEEKDDKTNITVSVDDGAKKVLEDTIVNIAENIDTTEVISDITRETLKNILNSDVSIQIKTDIEIVSDEEVNKEDMDEIHIFIDDKNQIVHYLNLKVIIEANGNSIGTINSLKDKITFTITVPKELLKEGRVFYVVRVHEGVAEKLPVTLNEDGTITFKTDKFSTYALVYEDGETTTPITPTTPTEDKKETTSNTNKGVDTGDTTNTTALITLMGLAIVVAGRKVTSLKNK